MPRAITYLLKKKNPDGMVLGLFYTWQKCALGNLPKVSLWVRERGKKWRWDSVPKEQIPFMLLNGRAT